MIPKPDYVVNPDDIAENFWGHTYMVYISAQGISFLVNAGCAQDALDFVMDLIVELGYVGLYSEEYDEEHISAGNFSYAFTTQSIYIEEV